MFADDTVLFANLLEELQTRHDALHVHLYVSFRNFTVNTAKTKTMVFK